METQQHPILQNELVTLRAYRKSDLELAVEYINDMQLRQLMWPGIAFPMRKEDEENWYNSFNAMSDGIYNFAIERNDTGEYIGGCGINDIKQRERIATVGILIGEPHQNNGLGTAAMRLLVEFCFLEMNIHKVKLCVFAFNQRAIACYEKIGFQTEGVLKEEIFRGGKYHDEYLMALMQKDWTKDKEEN